ncbi:Colicin-E3 immunity protein [Xenorhabdus hominickii]|uniref:Colicin-E3 immunity protein n=1 Tax=Xenorhabdus hominickii TaxID=351679 RepID=A0A2G0PKJ9_XENHO|nr:Colicin-E3 immunity protein [Xenorhabdus hominickii]
MSVRHFKTSEAADETIDMLNNRTGRQIGVANANTSIKDQAKVVLNQFHKEGLYVAKENASGFSVVKEKITDEQFSYMNSQYDRGDNAGFSPEQLANGERKESIIEYQ